MLVDDGNGFHDKVKGCLLVDKYCLLVFEFGSEGGKLIEECVRLMLRGYSGMFQLLHYSVLVAQEVFRFWRSVLGSGLTRLLLG